MSIIRIATSLFSFVIAAGSTGALAQQATKLPSLGADAKRVSVSGLSSGAFMAVQYEVAHSSDVMGIGVVAGGGYNCAGIVSFGNPFFAIAAAKACMDGTSNATASYLAAMGFAASRQIDDVSNIARHRVYLFSGTKDTTVAQAAMDHLRDFYLVEHVPTASITYVNSVPAGHAFISDHMGAPCGTMAAPYVNTCALTAGGAPYDQAGAILSHIYGALKNRSATPAQQPTAFDQTEFPGTVISGMAATGYAYLPSQCRSRSTKCAVHVVFHGCQQSADMLEKSNPAWRDDVYNKVGYNEWADTNGIIILYPQVNTSQLSPFNPAGCWDWWNYSGIDYQTKSGAQILAVQAMIDRLTN